MQHRVFSSCQTADPTPARHVLLRAPDSPTPPPTPQSRHAGHFSHERFLPPPPITSSPLPHPAAGQGHMVVLLMDVFGAGAGLHPGQRLYSSWPVCWFYVTHQNQLRLINNLWGTMTTAKVFQRPETIQDLKKIQLSQSSVNYSAELGWKFLSGLSVTMVTLRLNHIKAEISGRWWTGKRKITKTLILKENRCDRIIAALMSSADCRGVLDQINSCLLNF